MHDLCQRLTFIEGVCQEGDVQLHRLLDEASLNGDEITAEFRLIREAPESRLEVARDSIFPLFRLMRTLLVHPTDDSVARILHALQPACTERSIEVTFVPHVEEMYNWKEWPAFKRDLLALTIWFRVIPDGDEE